MPKSVQKIRAEMRESGDPHLVRVEKMMTDQSIKTLRDMTQQEWDALYKASRYARNMEGVRD